jgi:hypothetical protein
MLTAEVERLLDFAGATETEFTAFSDAMVQNVLNPMGQTLVNFGGGGLAEGFAFQQPYWSCQGALGQFLGEALMGLQTLRAAATIVAAQYAAGDGDSATLLATVNEAFAPPPWPTDPAAWEALAAQAREAEQADQNDQDAFAADVAHQRLLLDNPAYRLFHRLFDGGSEFKVPSSDYYDSGSTTAIVDGQPTAVRAVAGEGPGAIPIDPDRQNVNRLPIPDPGDTAIEDLYLFDLPTEQPDHIQDAVTETVESWASDDPPGTAHDE